MNENSLREIIKITMSVHPKDCIFESNAEEVIFNKVCHLLTNPIQEDILGALERAFFDSEIYCPHEGIDKRAEFGLSID